MILFENIYDFVWITFQNKFEIFLTDDTLRRNIAMGLKDEEIDELLG